MAQEEIIEGNKLISQFFVKVINHADVKDSQYYNPWDSKWGDEGKYHSSYNWLMPIVEDIEATLWVEITIKSRECLIDYGVTHDGTFLICKIGSSKILAVWQAVIQFIKWYNQNK